MKRALLISCFSVGAAFASVGTSLSNLVSAVSFWGREPDRFREFLWNPPSGGMTNENDREILRDWYLCVLRSPVPTNVVDNAVWSDIKGEALQMYAVSPGIVDSTNVWFAVADARSVLAHRLGCVSEIVSGDTVVTYTNEVIRNDRAIKKRMAMANGALRAQINAMDACIDDFLSGPYSLALPEEERGVLRSNLLQRAGRED